MKQYAIGTDIGGSHFSSAVIDLNDEKLIPGSLNYQKVNNKGTSEEILNSWKASLEKTLSGIDAEQLAGIGFAMPGPFEYDKGIAKFTSAVNKYENLYDVNIPEALGQLMKLPQGTQMRFMNDATSFAVGEAWMGEAKYYSKVVAITLGTGFGSAFIDSGVPVIEREDVPKQGCVWHLQYKDGIADDYFSTRWFIKRYKEATGKFLPGVKEIAGLAKSDNTAKNIFEEFGSGLGGFLAPLLKKFNTECIVIGGNITGAYNLWGNAFDMLLKNKGLNIAVKLSGLGETAAMIGSARLFDENFWQKVKPLLSKM